MNNFFDNQRINNLSYQKNFTKENQKKKFKKKNFKFLFIENQYFFIFQLFCMFGCTYQVCSVISNFLDYNIVVDIEIDAQEYSYLPSITISNDFYVFLNVTKLDQHFDFWKNLSLLDKTNNFRRLKNISSSAKLNFIYNETVLFENCTVYDVFNSEITDENYLKYKVFSRKIKQSLKMNDSFTSENSTYKYHKPPYKKYKCSDVADINLRTEYRDEVGWSETMFYVTLFYRKSKPNRKNLFKFNKMGNDLLMKINWEIMLNDEIPEFGFKIHIHDPFTSPNSKNAAVLGLNGKKNKWISLGYTHTVAKFLKKPFKTNCIDYSDYNFLSRQDCVDKCKFSLSKNYCNSLPLFTLLDNSQAEAISNKKINRSCFENFNIVFYCEHKCYKKDCITDYYAASILSNVGHSYQGITIDIYKPNAGVNQVFDYKQSMSFLELFVYLGSTISLWYGFSIFYLFKNIHIITENENDKKKFSLKQFLKKSFTTNESKKNNLKNSSMYKNSQNSASNDIYKKHLSFDKNPIFIKYKYPNEFNLNLNSFSLLNSDNSKKKLF